MVRASRHDEFPETEKFSVPVDVRRGFPLSSPYCDR